MAILNGDELDNVLTGTPQNDTINGNGGNDTLSGGDGNDILNGGTGSDTLDGGIGVDQVFGEDDDDTLVVSSLPQTGEIIDGGPGTDTLRLLESGALGVPTIFGTRYSIVLNSTTLSSLERLDFSAGNAIGASMTWAQLGAGLSSAAEIIGGAGLNQLSIGVSTAGTYTLPNFVTTNWSSATSALDPGDTIAMSVLFASVGNFTLNATPSHTIVQGLAGGNGNDILNGTDGIEILNAGVGADVLNAGGGDDVLRAVNTYNFQTGIASNLTFAGTQFNGGDGFDYLSVGGHVDFAGTLNLIEGINFLPEFFPTPPFTVGQEESVLVIDASNIAALPANLSLRGEGDLIVEMDAGDTFDGSQFVHVINSDVFVRVDGSVVGETITGTSGRDALIGAGGNDILFGLDGDDILSGDYWLDLFLGDETTVPGDDTLVGGNGSDTAYYGFSPGGVTVSLALQGGAQATGNGNDTLIGIENLYGSNSNDTLTGDGGNNVIEGAAGNDTIDGGGGNDTASYSDSMFGITISLAVGGAQNTIGAGTDTLIGIENLEGSDSDDTLTGDAGANLLYGLEGNDLLNGGGSDDLLDGGDQNDTASYAGASGGVTVNLSLAGVQATGGAGSDTLVSIENLIGSSFGDTLTGDGGANRIDGGAGSDVMVGCAGDDVYVVGSVGESVQELANEGNDTVLTSLETYTLPTSVETLIYTGNSWATLTGTSANDRIEGGPGLDSIFGEGGADVMVGRAGNDTYWVENVGDTIVEVDGEGTSDLVFSSVSYTLGANVEALQLTGSAIDGTGNSGDNILVGTFAANTLSGGAGNDTLRGAQGDDLLEGGSGNDIIDGEEGIDTASYATANAGVTVSLRITAAQNTLGAGTDTLTSIERLAGSSFNDTLLGTYGTLSVSGGAGSDTLGGSGDLIGGSGDDFYILDAYGGTVLETAGEGTDTVQSITSYVLGSHLENLVLAGSVWINGTGNSLDNMITGNTQSNILSGGAGIDRLTGGGDGDTFRDTVAGLNGDTITDLAFGEHIVLTDANLSGFAASLNGSTLTFTGGALTVTNSPAGRLVVTAAAGGGVDLQLARNRIDNDYNGDGRSDILWRNSNGQLSNWLGTANGGFVQNDANAFTTVPTEWRVVGNGDYNGDGRSDILWRDTVTGQLSDWLGQANGGFVQNDANALTTTPTSWSVVGSGDYNGDGRSDILWRNANGQLSNWLGQANGGFAQNDANAFTAVPTEWSVAGNGDFNGDGRSDVLWRNANGQLSDWLGQANGGFAQNDANALTTVSTAWRVAGTGDFNGDGRDDILWRNSVTGQLSDWLGQASGGFAQNDANAFTTVPTDWQVVDTGDYNGDGRDDILWRNANGSLSDWLGQANGGFTQNDANAFNAVPVSWTVEPVSQWL